MITNVERETPEERRETNRLMISVGERLGVFLGFNSGVAAAVAFALAVTHNSMWVVALAIQGAFYWGASKCTEQTRRLVALDASIDEIERRRAAFPYRENVGAPLRASDGEDE